MNESSGNCGKCGVCLTVCPVFSVLKEEQVSPRAKMRLIKALSGNDLKPTPLLKELVDKCLMCGNCQAICPSGVDLFTQYKEIRAQLGNEVGELKEIRALIFMLAHETKLGPLSGLARMGQKMLPKFLQKMAKVGDFPLSRFPQVNAKPLRNRLPEITPAKGKELGTVLYFTGCATNYLFEDTGLATVKLLSALGYQVIIPKEQTCCGAPMVYHGAFDQALAKVQSNIACLSRYKASAIIVDCPTCKKGLQSESLAVIKHFQLNEQKAQEVADKVMNLGNFLNQQQDELRQRIAKQRKITSQLPQAVSYHAPCHLRNFEASTDKLLQALAPAIDYRPASDMDTCCGGGGTFFCQYPEIAGNLAREKCNNARNTGAAIWLTDCPVCRIQLGAHLKENDTLKLMHPVHYLLPLLSEG
jgi:glycolate oxidase iron-sulfur subunit